MTIGLESVVFEAMRSNYSYISPRKLKNASVSEALAKALFEILQHQSE
jgi:hypothetical protein